MTMSSMSDNPDPAQIASDEARIGALLRAGHVPAPPALKHGIIERNLARQRRRWWQGMPAIALALSGAASGACAALILLLTAGGAAAPTVVQASLVALERPMAAAPHALKASGTTIVFPDWARRGWPIDGMRSDRVQGRTVTTVFYRSSRGGMVGYAIVAGPPLRHGAKGVTATRMGEGYVSISRPGEQIVTWVEAGHTCILASRTVPRAALWKLAVSQGSRTSA
jgi:hypothetical protein